MRPLTAVLILLMLAGCTTRPPADAVEPEMTAAVRTVAGERCEVRRELVPRCGPTDQRLESLILQLVAEVPSRSVDLAAVVASACG